MATPEPRTLATLNACSRETFVAALGEVFEHASWVTEAALSRRPFATVAAVHQAMVETLRQLDAEHRTRASIPGSSSSGTATPWTTTTYRGR